MSVTYSAVQWSPHKRRYDALALAGVAVFVAAYVGGASLLHRGEAAIGPEVLVIRSLGAAAATLLHAVLMIGPLARLDPRWLPLLANRRHLGVLTFVLALGHAALATGYYHGFGVIDPLRSLLAGSGTLWPPSAFPFELLGLAALVILLLLAATSHDFWLRNLSARWWKRLHMLAYGAYGLIVAHVALGALQSDRSFLATGLVLGGVALLTGLHIAAALRERRTDARADAAPDAAGWIDAGQADTIPQDRARTICAPGGVRIAVFRHAGEVSAITNVCAHQGGPLGEGRVIDGCVTCPWHGWQYRAADGVAPPPFKERVATYPVRIVGGRVQVQATPRAPGDAAPPVPLPPDQGPPHRQPAPGGPA